MRRLLLLTAFFPACALADPLTATSRIADVTIYGSGARVVREVTFDAPAGVHQIMLGDLPQSLTESGALRIAAGPGVTVGAWGLTDDGVPTGPVPLSTSQQAASDRVLALEADERALLARIDAIAARIEAAEAQAGFLRGLGTGESGVGSATPEALAALAAMVGSGVSQAATARGAAMDERRGAEADLARLQIDLGHARGALAGLDTGDNGSRPVLKIDLASAAGGPGTLQVSYLLEDAMWSPVYDIDLARKAGRMTVTRGVVVSQATGEDWTDVALTLSTARPGEQAAPSTLYPDLRRIEPEQPPMPEGDAMMAGAPMLSEPVMEAAVVGSRMASAVAGFVGDTVVYTYAPPVSLASGVQELRLNLGSLDLTPTLQAVAVPRGDTSAYLQAKTVNTSDEILLPGQALLYRDGGLVAGVDLETIAPGADFTLSFGAIEGLRLSRTTPVRAEAETGILTSSSEIKETATLKVENLTDEEWAVRVLDQVPFSEQEDLQITYRATPEPDETRVDDQRGMLAWDLALPAGQSAEIVLDHTISWPEGMVLQ